jgi:hypothetical protein
MARVTSTLLLLVGAVLLVAWLVTPAASAPQAVVSRDAPPDQTLPVLADVNAQVDRLRERLNTPVAYPPPSRDPFNYRALPPRSGIVGPDVSRPVEPSPTIAVAPPLVAILTTGADAGAVRSAVFADSDGDVRVVAVGESVGTFRVSAIEEDVVVLSDARTGQVVRVTLR